MSTPTERHSRKKKFLIEFPVCTGEGDDRTKTYEDLFYELNVKEGEATLQYQGQTINITLGMLIDVGSLGEGNFGHVMLTTVRDHPNIRMAVKRLELLPSTNNPDQYTTRTDLRMLRSVGSGLNSHVTSFYTAMVDQPHRQLVICMEPCETSMDKFSLHMHRLTETTYLDLLLKRMISHIVDALIFLKSKDILHRDVKPSNILINQNPLIFKLCDFGICGTLVNSVAFTMMKGTQIYLAPERIDRNLSPNGYGIRSDMWALGLTAYEIAVNGHPFFEKVATQILNIVETWTPQFPSNLSLELQELLSWLLKVKQEDRPDRYENILASRAMQALPAEITTEETNMVKTIIDQIPLPMDN